MSYITVQDIRDEGVSLDDYPNVRIEERITLAQNSIEQILKCFFELRTSYVIYLHGNGYKSIDLPVPPARPIPPETAYNLTVEIDGSVLDSSLYFIDMDEFPDGRLYPSIEMISGIWPKGRRNIKITGDFGFVDIVGTAYQTPDNIKDLCKRIAVYNLPEISDEEGQRAKRIISESLNKYRYTLSEANRRGFYGDSDIDRLIGMYQITVMTTL